MQNGCTTPTKKPKIKTTPRKGKALLAAAATHPHLRRNRRKTKSLSLQKKRNELRLGLQIIPLRIARRTPVTARDYKIYQENPTHFIRTQYQGTAHCLHLLILQATIVRERTHKVQLQ